MVRVACIAVDWDFASAHFSDNTDGVNDIFRRLGVPEEMVLKARQETEEQGFSIERFTENIEKLFPSLDDKKSNKKSIGQEFQSWLRESLVAYPESKCEFLKWKTLGIPIVIITAGDQEYQHQKINIVGLPHDEVIVVNPQEGKVAAIGGLLKKYGGPIIFVDDKPSELKLVRAHFGKEVVATLIARRNSPYRNEHEEYAGPKLVSLTGVNTIIKVLQEKFIVRRAVREDTPCIARINSEVFLGNRGDVDTALDWINCWFKSYPLYQYFVAEVGDTEKEIIGYIGWQIHGGFSRADPVIELEQIGTDRTVQGLGVGPHLENTIGEVIRWLKSVNTRIESNFYVIVWGYSLNFNAMKIYAEKFNEGVLGLRKMYGDRAESMFRWRMPMVKPIRKDD